MQNYMVVATFRPGTVWDEVMAVVAQEQAAVAELRQAGALNEVFLATAARKTAFLHVNAASEEEAVGLIKSLPMATWWELDVYPLNAPGPSS